MEVEAFRVLRRCHLSRFFRVGDPSARMTLVDQHAVAPGGDPHRQPTDIAEFNLQRCTVGQRCRKSVVADRLYAGGWGVIHGKLRAAKQQFAVQAAHPGLAPDFESQSPSRKGRRYVASFIPFSTIVRPLLGERRLLFFRKPIEFRPALLLGRGLQLPARPP
jgi:hypothetical protein